MLERLEEKGVIPEKQVYFPNRVDARQIYPMQTVSVFRKKLGICKQSVVALYSGNMGEKQGLEIIVEAARKLKDNHGIVFVLCGGGAAYDRLRIMAGGLLNIHWLPLQPNDRLNDLLNLADVHLLPQRGAASDAVMPSKLTGMLASGRPVLAMAESGGEIAQVLKAAGLVVPFEDVDTFVSALKRLAENQTWRLSMGQAGRRYAEKYLDKAVVLSRFEQAALDCVFSRN
jgi:colanic acid biosynthesis glycosyl transferase WcaI